jgi:hypothetical protein
MAIMTISMDFTQPAQYQYHGAAQKEHIRSELLDVVAARMKAAASCEHACSNFHRITGSHLCSAHQPVLNFDMISFCLHSAGVANIHHCIMHSVLSYNRLTHVSGLYKQSVTPCDKPHVICNTRLVA